MNNCRICGNQERNTLHEAREMMLGTRDTFNYFKCGNCGCLQISDIPDNLGEYYPKLYYSYDDQDKLCKKKLRQWGDHKRVEDILDHSSITGRLFNSISKPLDYANYITKPGITCQSKILDVGCGSGRLIMRMHMGGFYNVLGLDPFIERTIKYSNDVEIKKETIENFAQSTQQDFDLIMMHHSLEHMPDQLTPLLAAKNLLAKQGILLIRIPLCDSYAWDKYKEHWVQLDAPRHLYLNTKKSMKILAQKANLDITSIEYDSSKFQFTGSELYLRDIPLNANKNIKNQFSRQIIREFNAFAQILNQQGKGDQACFYLQHAKL